MISSKCLQFARTEKDKEKEEDSLGREYCANPTRIVNPITAIGSDLILIPQSKTTNS